MVLKGLADVPSPNVSLPFSASTYICAGSWIEGLSGRSVKKHPTSNPRLKAKIKAPPILMRKVVTKLESSLLLKKAIAPSYTGSVIILSSTLVHYGVLAK